MLTACNWIKPILGGNWAGKVRAHFNGGSSKCRTIELEPASSYAGNSKWEKGCSLYLDTKELNLL